MTRDEHIALHRQLHDSLDRLLADFLDHNRGRVPSNTTVTDLMTWSHQQTIEPQTQAQGHPFDMVRHFVTTGLRAQQAVDELLKEPKT